MSISHETRFCKPIRFDTRGTLSRAAPGKRRSAGLVAEKMKEGRPRRLIRLRGASFGVPVGRMLELPDVAS
ncbi:MAG: hypothetical protein C4294_10460 [Nitrospiraceae bacterium]